MFDFLFARGTTPRRRPDAAIVVALTVFLMVVFTGTPVLVLLAPMRTDSGRDARPIDLLELNRWLGDPWADWELERRAGWAAVAGLMAAAFAARNAWARTPLREAVTCLDASSWCAGMS